MSRKEDTSSKTNRPHVDQSALNFGSRSAATTDASSARTISSYTPPHQRATAVEQQKKDENNDKKSFVSAYFYRSDTDAHRFLRPVEGRVFNALNETYFLPADEPEWMRLNKLHVAFILAFEGLYPSKETVNAILAPQDGVKKRILDLAWGRRRAAPGQPAPPFPVFPPVPLLPPISSPSLVEDANLEADPFFSSFPYPLFYVCDTQEQALAEDALRKRSKEGFVTLPLPS